MRHLICRQSSFLIAVDLQERLVPAIADRPQLLHRATTLLNAARLLDVPRVFTEHCADRIGPTVPSLYDAAGSVAVLEKTCFALTREAGVADRLKALERPQAIIFGAEAHVCVLQSAIGLIEADFAVFLVTDAVGSRHPHDRHCAIERAAQLGITPVTTEMVLFEWLERGDSDHFSEILPMIRNLP